jgi:hypothetical protein
VRMFPGGEIVRPAEWPHLPVWWHRKSIARRFEPLRKRRLRVQSQGRGWWLIVNPDLSKEKSDYDVIRIWYEQWIIMVELTVA